MIIDGKYWNADRGDGKYTNPVLYTDYSDPDVCRVGDDFFMVASSFCNAPGLPVLHSKDLVNWKLINYAIRKVPGKQYDRPLHGCGVWAPAIRYHEGEFIIFFPMPDEGIYVVKTKNPWKEWDEPYCLYEGKGWIDPCPFWDEDGRAYMVSAFAKSRIGFKSILNLCEITPDCKSMINEGKYIFDGAVNNQETIEGPKLYKRNGYYYIFAPAGGVKQGWQTVLRSKNIWGPYEYRIVLMQKDTMVNGPHQGAWVDTVKGEDWFIHFQDVYAAGRIVHLQPMTWENDWPVIGEYAKGETCGKPVMTYKKPDTGYTDEKWYVESSDDFETASLGLWWQWNANPKENWYHIEQGKGLVLHAVDKLYDSISDYPQLLLQKWNMPTFTCTTRMNVKGLKENEFAGMIQMGISYASVGVLKAKDGFVIQKRYGDQHFINERSTAKDEICDVTNVSDIDDIFFSIEVKKLEPDSVNEDGPYRFPIPRELVSLSYSLDGMLYHKVYEFEAKAGRWVGAKVGVFCSHEDQTQLINDRGNVIVKYFHFGDSLVY